MVSEPDWEPAVTVDQSEGYLYEYIFLFLFIPRAKYQNQKLSGTEREIYQRINNKSKNQQ